MRMRINVSIVANPALIHLNMKYFLMDSPECMITLKVWAWLESPPKAVSALIRTIFCAKENGLIPMAAVPVVISKNPIMKYRAIRGIHAMY